MANVTFLATYDCESESLPKSNNTWQAMKQIDRAWYTGWDVCHTLEGWLGRPLEKDDAC
jgi:hypothetical protein